MRSECCFRANATNICLQFNSWLCDLIPPKFVVSLFVFIRQNENSTFSQISNEFIYSVTVYETNFLSCGICPYFIPGKQLVIALEPLSIFWIDYRLGLVTSRHTWCIPNCVMESLVVGLDCTGIHWLKWVSLYLVGTFGFIPHKYSSKVLPLTCGKGYMLVLKLWYLKSFHILSNITYDSQIR